MTLLLMKTKLLFTFLIFGFLISFSQTKVSGYVYDEANEPVAFANVLFKDSSKGTITDENGKFYLEDDETWSTILVSFVGYETQELTLDKKVTYNLKLNLKEDSAELDTIVIVSGKQSKKNNPAIDILRKIWAKKHQNGLNKFDQYQYDKYEKIEFDLNTIDSNLIKSKIFRGLEFMFENLDTSSVTGKTYLPIFLNETASKVYGDNIINKVKDSTKGSRNSGFNGNESITSFVKDLYTDYDIYNNYLKFFDKSFTSPLSRTGINTYNYVLADTSYIDGKQCFNIIFYPRRKNELTFKGDFWVADSTFAIKEISMNASKSANINWVKEIYIEQEFTVLNDSVFLLKRDYMLSDFAFNKKEKSRGMYGKRTTLYDNYKFDVEKTRDFYDEVVNPFNEDLYKEEESFWDTNRLEKLNKDEKSIYKLLDTLKTVPKFKRMYNLISILGSGYAEFDKLNLDYGPIFSTFGYNDIEGVRIRTGGRTYFGRNDKWRLQGYLAYGFGDNKFKYGLSGKWLLNPKNRLIIAAGNRRDIEQTGVSLTVNDDVLGRSFASSALFTAGDNDRLTDVNLTKLSVEMEPWKNIKFLLGGTYKSLKSASPDTFSLSYIDPNDPNNIRNELDQVQVNFTVDYTPGKKTIYHGVERKTTNDNFPRIFMSFTKGLDGISESDFNFTKLQLYYLQPFQIGGFGRLHTTVELGKTFGEIPLGLLSVVPGNQTYFSIFNTFPQLNFYEFITDSYASFHVQHNFNGRLFSRIPFLRKLNLREFVGFRTIIGDISEANVALNNPAFSSLPFGTTTLTPDVIAPKNEPYWEYSFGIGNIFKVFRIDFNFRGNYFDRPDARKFGVTGTFGFYF